MAIESWLSKLGFRLESAAEGAAIRSGAMPLQWPAGHTPGSLVYRLPRDPAHRASLFSKQQTIVVNEGEAAVVLLEGRSDGFLEPGRYVFEKQRVVGALDIVWVRTGQQSLKWGVGNVTSADRINISGRGMLYTRIIDAEKFNREVIQGKVVVSESDVQRHYMPRIQSVLRSQIARANALDLEMKRHEFVDVVTVALQEEFTRMGMAIEGFEVIEITLPPEFQAIIAQATMETHAGQAALIAATRRAQITQVEAAAAAQAKLLDKMADVQAIEAQMAAGIDPMKLKLLDAVEALAVNQPDVQVGGGATHLIAQLAGAVVSAPPTPPPAAPKQIEAAPAPSGGGGDKIADIERQIEQLDDKLVSGEISEAKHNSMMERYEARLARLRDADDP